MILPHEHGGEEDGVERDVVFADKMDELCLRVEPVVFPAVRMANFLGPFFRRRDVADRGVEPDVKHLARTSGNGDAPVGVAGDCAGFEIVDVVHRKANDVFFPVLLFDPGGELLFELVEAEIEMAAGLEDKGRAGELGTGGF